MEFSELPSLNWRKSSYSIANGDCVEVAGIPADGVILRDSLDRGMMSLSFGSEAWKSFTNAVKRAG